MKTTASMSGGASVSALHGVGPSMQERLANIGVRTLHDLVYYFPRDYEDLSQVLDMIDCTEGAKVTVRGTVTHIASRRAWKKRGMSITEAVIADATADMHVVWFNQPYIAESVRVDDQLFFSGVVKRTSKGLTLTSPVYEKAIAGCETTHTARIVPKYPLTRGITQKQLRYYIKQALQRLLPMVDALPERVIQTFHLLPLSTALHDIHFPETLDAFRAAKQRLEFDQLFLIQLHAQQSRAQLATVSARALKFHEDEIKSFVAGLPFALTQAQRRSAWAILKDMQAPHPMNRLLSGDVGSGKTVVAAIAILHCVLNNAQAVLMAPTEILAAQHARTLRELFASRHIPVELWTSSTKPTSGGAVINAPIVVGTHALIQRDVQFHELGLTVVDEQHRFGVEQRKTITQHAGSDGAMPHLLSMTATPIPRTMALAIYGDLDLSVMDEMPKNRKQIITRVVGPQKRAAAYEFIRTHVRAGEQCFVICPLVEQSDLLGATSVAQEYERLTQKIFPDLRVGMLHGKMKSTEKEIIMRQMSDRTLDILVSTSVIEVGVDIPHATIMMIEGAERFGLAQLHQFRGRVGRSDVQSYCFLFSSSGTAQSLGRLRLLETLRSGFALAEKDLQLRGAGEVYGTAQSGVSPYAVLSLQQPQLIEHAQRAAKIVLDEQLLEQSDALQKKLHAFSLDVHLE